MESILVRRSAILRPEPDANAIYQYPEHLREWLEGLPNHPGVYTFHGESESLPLYIGKSVNLRSRVMSHFRAPDEAKMLRQSRRVSWIPTAGDLGALLLEAQMIKTQQPLFNKRLRKTGSSVHCRLPTANRMWSMQKTSISASPPTCLGSIAVASPRWNGSSSSRMSISSVMACWVWKR